MLRHILLCIILITVFSNSYARTPANEAPLLAKKLGMMLIVHVDNAFSLDGGVHPGYKNLIRNWNIGGVILENSNITCGETVRNPAKVKDKWKKAAANRCFYEIAQDLRTSTRSDLFIAEDYFLPKDKLNFFNKNLTVLPSPEQIGELGDSNCAYVTGYLSGMEMKVFGYNVVLGPITEIFDVERFNEKKSPSGKESGYFGNRPDQVQNLASSYLDGLMLSGIVPTLKHFPYDSNEFDTHSTLLASHKSCEEMDDGVETFRCLHYELTQNSKTQPWLMTTHTYNANEDADHLVTFSPTWIAKAREIAGEDGLIITDGLFMNGLYPKDLSKNQMLKREFRGFDSEYKKIISSPLIVEKNPRTGKIIRSQLSKQTKQIMAGVYAVKAIVSGQDFILLEGDVLDSQYIANYIYKKASQDNDLGSQLRERINASYDRIQRYKEKNASIFSQPTETFAYEMAGQLNDAVKAGNTQACQVLAEKARSISTLALEK